MRKIIINVKEVKNKGFCLVQAKIKDTKKVSVSEMKTGFIIYGKIENLLKENQR